MILIDDKAFKWFEAEFQTAKPFSIRLYPQYAGFGEKNKGYSLAFALEVPTNCCEKQERDGITFYVESNDKWFFEQTDIEIKFNDSMSEIYTVYNEIQ